MVEEVHRALDEPLVLEGDDLRLTLRLLLGDVVEVLQGRRQAVPALLRTVEGQLHAPLDDGLVHLGEWLPGLLRRCARLRQGGVDFEGELFGSGRVRNRRGVEGVQVDTGPHTEVVDRTAEAPRYLGVLARAVDDVDFVRGVREDGAGHLGLDEHALARTVLPQTKPMGLVSSLRLQMTRLRECLFWP